MPPNSQLCPSAVSLLLSWCGEPRCAGAGAPGGAGQLRPGHRGAQPSGERAAGASRGLRGRDSRRRFLGERVARREPGRVGGKARPAGLSRPRVVTVLSLHLPLRSLSSMLASRLFSCRFCSLPQPARQASWLPQREEGGMLRQSSRAGLSAAVVGLCCCSCKGLFQCSRRMKWCREERCKRGARQGAGWG